MNRPRIVHVTTTDISLALLLGPQLEAFVAAGYDVIGLSAPGPFVPALSAIGVEHVPLKHATRAMAPHRDLGALAELRAQFRRLRPALVHTHNPKPGVYGRLAARMARVPAVVNTVHGLYAQPGDRWRRRALVYSLERVAARCSDVELVQNPEDIETLAALGIPRTKLRLLGNGIDLQRFHRGTVDPDDVAAARRAWGIGPDDVVCGVVGRLVREKGYPEVFAAARILRRTAPHVRVVIAGPLDLDKADAVTKEEIDAAGRDVGVVYLGMRDDIELLYAAMDVHVLASYREGFPRSPMEASAFGVPVVATDIRGCRQAVDDGVTGLLVAPRDAEALAAAIAALAHDPARRRAMGKAAEEKAHRDFDVRRVIATTLDTYRGLIGEPPAPAVPGSAR